MAPKMVLRPHPEPYPCANGTCSNYSNDGRFTTVEVPLTGEIKDRSRRDLIVLEMCAGCAEALHAALITGEI